MSMSMIVSLVSNDPIPRRRGSLRQSQGEGRALESFVGSASSALKIGPGIGIVTPRETAPIRATTTAYARLGERVIP
jgi:hypothetical protein